MKMSQNSYDNIVEKFSAISDKIKDYAVTLKKEGGYNDFNTRLTWDCLNATIGSTFICNQYYRAEKLNDNHITTAGIKALKQLQII